MTKQHVGLWLLLIAAVLVCAGIGVWDGSHRTGLYPETLANGSQVIVTDRPIPASYWHTAVVQPSNGMAIALLILGGAAGIGGGLVLIRRA